MEFGAGEFDGLAFDEDLPGGGKDADKAGGDDLFDVFRLRVYPAEYGFHAGEEDFDAEGLCDVVVCADAEADDNIGFAVLGGQQNDGYAGGFGVVFELRCEAYAGDIGQKDVEQDEFGLLEFDCAEGLGGVERGADLVAFRRQAHAEQVEQVFLVIDDKDFSVHINA